MTRYTKLITFVTMFASSVAVSSLAYAQAAAATAAPIDEAKAMSIAEQQTKGKAANATLENAGGKSVYNVEVMQGKQPVNVKVDATTGAVISSTPAAEKAAK